MREKTKQNIVKRNSFSKQLMKIDTNLLIRSRRSKNRQCNGQKKQSTKYYTEY